MFQGNTYYVYVAKSLDTIFNLCLRFGITEQKLNQANPQWNNRVVIFLKVGEEVIMPDDIEKSPMFWMYKSQLITRRRKPTEKTGKYPANWFPPKPNFGSPSVPLSALLAKLGNPKYRIGTRPDGKLFQRPIIFTDGWVGKNISKVSIPQLKGIPIPIDDNNSIPCSGTIDFYTRAHKAVQELFNAWESDGLTSKILTFDGAFNPRTIGSGINPSNHSFGTAFDINAKWNRYKHQPAKIGEQGCLLELVPRASELGFFWGGFYTGNNVDGMHFEYAYL